VGPGLLGLHGRRRGQCGKQEYHALHSGSPAVLGQARTDAALFDVECRTLVGLGVEPALADLFTAVAQARADFALRQRVALVLHPVAAATVAVAMAMVAAVSVAGRWPGRRWRGRVDAAEAQGRRAYAAVRAVAAARGRGGRARRRLAAAVGDAGAAPARRAVVVRPGRYPARIAVALVAGVAAAVVADAFVHRSRIAPHHDRLRRRRRRGLWHGRGDGFGTRRWVAGLDHAPGLLRLVVAAGRVLHGQVAVGVGAAVDGDVAFLRERAAGQAAGGQQHPRQVLAVRHGRILRDRPVT